MASMTDFINSIHVPDHLNVYNEDYSWAEQYAEYYDENSANYVQPVLESPGYQFFGEAAFYQEAHKGLIAGGILALVSGAFFMIMKLLKGDGGSGNNNGVTKPSPSSGQNKMPKSGNRIDDATKEALERKARGDKLSKEQEKLLNERKERREKLHEKWDKEDEEFFRKNQERREKKRKELEERQARLNKDIDNINQMLSGKPQEQSKQEKPKPESKVEMRKYENLEAEEKLTFNVKIIINELNKIKKEGYENISINHGLYNLDDILNGLETIEEITDYMVGLVKDGKWNIFGSNDIKDPVVKNFQAKCNRLSEIAANLMNKADQYKMNDSMSNDYIGSVIKYLNDIDRVSKQIETKCKTGMNMCKEQRKKLINEQKDVSNVDKAYKILNNIIHSVNRICKKLQEAFKTIHRDTNGRSHPFPINPNYFHMVSIGSMEDIFEDLTDGNVFHYIKSFNKHPDRVYNHFTDSLKKFGEHILYANDHTMITDKKIKAVKASENALKNLKNGMKEIPKHMEKFKHHDFMHRRAYELIEDVVIDGYRRLIDLYETPIEDMVGQTQSKCTVPAVISVMNYFREYILDDPVGDKRSNISDQIVNIFEPND